MKPTKGKVALSDDGKYIHSPHGWIAEVVSWPTSPAAVREGTEKHQANGALFVAAWNACFEINPENPIAAAEAMPEIFRLLLAVVADAQKICGKRLDLEEWLMKANETVDKAMKEAR